GGGGEGAEDAGGEGVPADAGQAGRPLRGAGDPAVLGLPRRRSPPPAPRSGFCSQGGQRAPRDGMSDPRLLFRLWAARERGRDSNHPQNSNPRISDVESTYSNRVFPNS